MSRFRNGRSCFLFILFRQRWYLYDIVNIKIIKI